MMSVSRTRRPGSCSGAICCEGPNAEVATLLHKNQSSMRPRERRSRKANSESLDEAGDAAHVHIKRVARAKRREPLLIRRAADQFRS